MFHYGWQLFCVGAHEKIQETEPIQIESCIICNTYVINWFMYVYICSHITMYIESTHK